MSADGDFYRATVNVARAIAAHAEKDDRSVDIASLMRLGAELLEIENQERIEWLWGDMPESPEEAAALTARYHRAAELRDIIFDGVTIVYAN